MELNNDERKIVEYLEEFEKYLRSHNLNEIADYIQEHINFEYTA